MSNHQRRAAGLLLVLAAGALVGVAHVTQRSELIGGYENGAANYYGALPPVYGPVTVTQTVVPRTSVIVPICDRLGCYQMNACVDRFDFQTEYGGCEVYRDWTQRMGYCNDDKDAFGVKASMACPVSCDSCALGMCFTPSNNEMIACDGDGQVFKFCSLFSSTAIVMGMRCNKRFVCVRIRGTCICVYVYVYVCFVCVRVCVCVSLSVSL